jgi:hypothetical protein
MSSVRIRTAVLRGFFAALILLAAFCAANAQKHGSVARHDHCSLVPLVIQGRITAVDGDTLTMKPPDSYPGGEGGVHAHFVVAALPIRVDISHARILLADGKQEDTRAFTVGAQVVVVLTSSPSGPPSPENGANPNQLSTACVIERIESGDKIVTH